jgi:6-phosphogluconolactonase
MIYRLDGDRGKLEPADEPWVETAPGAGPRQIAMHPNGAFAYLINELDSTMTAFRYEAATGRLRALQTLPTLPEGFTGRSTCAEVQIAPSGRFLYGSNRGHDSLAIYAVDPANGTLALVGHESTRGRIPRNFEIAPSGDLVIAANQDTGNLVTFRADSGTGRLAPTGHEAEAPTPICVKVL